LAWRSSNHAIVPIATPITKAVGDEIPHSPVPIANTASVQPSNCAYRAPVRSGLDSACASARARSCSGERPGWGGVDVG
jgi:hypothetical protein